MAKMMINGEHLDSVTGEVTEIRNPANGEVVDAVPKGNAEDVRRAIAAAEAAFLVWSRIPGERRGAALMGAAEVIGEHVQEIAPLLTKEQGKPVRDAGTETGRF